MIDQRLLSAGLVFAAALMLGLAATLILRDRSAKEIEARVIDVTHGRRAQDPAPGSPVSGIWRLPHWIGQTVAGNKKFYSARDIMLLEAMIAGSGMNPSVVLPVVLGLKAILAIAIPAIGFAYVHLAGYAASTHFITLCACIPLGILGPEWALGLLRRRYMAALRRGIPDALDLLVVCSEAGMALESALQHVSTEIRHSNPVIAVALAKLLDELLVLPDRREAFRNFGQRSGVDGARRLATMLGQAMQYGTPLSQVLRVIALDLRRERMLALETKASRLPVLLVMPLILFIMPSMFIVLAGPAMIKLTDTLHTVTRNMAAHQ